MIVICTKCQAKFRVADEKIGPRGAKVRCSKCQTVFLVKPEGGAPPPPRPAPQGIDLEPPSGPLGGTPHLASAARWDPTQPDLSPRAIPPPLPPRTAAPEPFPPPAPDDPFAPSASPDPFAPSASPDPFAPSASPDPFAPSASPDPFAPSASPDPFGAGTSHDPFAAPAGDDAPAHDPLAAPPPDPLERSGAGVAPTDLGDLLAAAASAAGTPEEAADAPGVTAGGLSLEDRPASSPRPASSAPFDLGMDAGYEAFAGAVDARGFEPGGYELGSDVAAAAAAAAPEPGPLETARRAPPAAQPVAPPPPEGPAGERIPGRPSGLRAAVVNAVALVALLAAAVAILALWRTEGRLSALRPSSIVAALRDGAAALPFSPREVRSGLYERDRAPPVLFVRGSVVSQAPAPVRRLRVRVEIVRAGAVLASGEGVAGAVLTPEELWSARDPAALAAAATRAERRAPAEVRPGDAVPFLVAIADHPSDLAGASLRVEAAPDGSAAP